MVGFYKICPSCGVEFVHTAEHCSDCGVPLTHRSDPEATPDLPPAAELSALVRVGPWEADRIATALDQAGIPSRIDTFPPGSAIEGGRNAYLGQGGHGIEVCVYVLAADREAAEGALNDYRAATLPDAGPAADTGEELSACPACGTRFAPGATSCHECGLEFYDPGYECTACGSELTAEDERCPNCGADLSPGGST